MNLHEAFSFQIVYFLSLFILNGIFFGEKRVINSLDYLQFKMRN